MANQVLVNVKTSKGTWETTFQKSTRIKDVILGSRMHFRLSKETKLVLCRQELPHVDFDPDRALEQGLYSTSLGIAGRVDCIAEYDKELTVIDFKTATRKRDERNENYPVQASFYSIAWEERTGEKINQIAILTTTEDGKLDVYRDDPSNHVGRHKSMVKIFL